MSGAGTGLGPSGLSAKGGLRVSGLKDREAKEGLRAQGRRQLRASAVGHSGLSAKGPEGPKGVFGLKD